MTDMGDGEVAGGTYRSLARDTRLVTVAVVSFYATLGSNVASAALPAIADGLAVSDSRVGLVITVFSLFAMVSVPASGVLADAYGRRRVLLPSILAYGITGSAIAFVGTFEAVLALRAVQGVAFAAIMPTTVTLLGDLYTGSSASAAQGFRTATNGIGSSIVPAVAGVLAGISWNYPFLIYLLFAPVFALALRFIPEPVRNSRTDPGEALRIRRYIGRVRREVTAVDVGVLLVGASVRDFVRYALLTFVPLFAVRVLDATVAQAGTILSVRGIAYVLVSPLSGVAVGARSRKAVLISSLLLSGSAVLAMTFVPSVLWLAVTLGIYSVGDSLFSPVIKDAVTALASDERRGGVVSAMNVLKYAGKTAAPAFFGAVLALLSFDYVFYVATVVAVTYGVVLFFAVDQL